MKPRRERPLGLLGRQRRVACPRRQVAIGVENEQRALDDALMGRGRLAEPGPYALQVAELQ
ncbi:MAG: hypothetical protein RIM80_21315, partial [Alphaproteobacteria bacterium]